MSRRKRRKKRTRHKGYRKQPDPRSHRTQWPRLDQPFYLWEYGLTRWLPPAPRDTSPKPPVIRQPK